MLTGPIVLERERTRPTRYGSGSGRALRRRGVGADGEARGGIGGVVGCEDEKGKIFAWQSWGDLPRRGGGEGFFSSFRVRAEERPAFAT